MTYDTSFFDIAADTAINFTTNVTRIYQMKRNDNPLFINGTTINLNMTNLSIELVN